MSDDKSKREYHDRDRINVNEAYELDYWTKELGVSADRLKELVSRHGVMASDIRKELRNNKAK